ncbi:MAG: flagellar basal body rod protein FlgB [Hyphomicrobiaceae bacterium]
MTPVSLFDLATRHNDWLAVRQRVVAENVANANTPGYAAKTVEPFDSVLESQSVLLNQTSGRHMAASSQSYGSYVTESKDTWQVKHSGNTVSVEQEMIEGSSIKSAYSLNVNVMQAFHRMLLSAVRS